MRATLSRASGPAVQDELARNRPVWECEMLTYTEHTGIPGRYAGEFRWHKLQDAACRMGVETSGISAHSE